LKVNDYALRLSKSLLTCGKYTVKRAFPKTRKARGAQGIAAEIPQDLHKQIRGIGAESPVCGGLCRKCAKIPNRSKIANEFWERLY
jgi:hypothetical protein